MSFAGALRIGALYLGPFHHVALVIEGDLDVDVSRLPGSSTPIGGSATVELGVALLAVTALAVWLLFRAGRASGSGDGPGARALSGSAVALGYAPPVLLVALLVRFEEPVELGSFVTGGVRVSMSVWQALVFPLAIAAIAGAFGGLWSWVRSAGERPPADPDPRGARRGVADVPARSRALVPGAVRGGDRAARRARGHGDTVDGALLLDRVRATGAGRRDPRPSRWRSRRTRRCGRSCPPSEGATWCGGASVRSSCATDGSPPVSPRTGTCRSGTRPAGYLAFLLVPAVATIVGGRWAGSTAEGAGTSGAAIGAASGVGLRGRWSSPPACWRRSRSPTVPRPAPGAVAVTSGSGPTRSRGPCSRSPGVSSVGRSVGASAGFTRPKAERQRAG